ncbi:MAG: hypothetical protein AUG49_04275 [Catenulispora sp. 13_1_20CM_3_70_7]|nr:MAG: hypothetical protein AUG49_04275 [Catenulispora sp. 13_1_20CM_3_70_7]
MIDEFTGAEVVRTLRSADPGGARLFATATAEVLVAWFPPEVPLEPLLAAGQDLTRRSLRYLWDSVESGGAPGEGQDLQTEIEGLLEEYADEIGLFEDALAGLHYAVQNASRSDLGQVGLVAEKLYEATEERAIERSVRGSRDFREPAAIRSLPEIQRVLRFLGRALDLAVELTPGTDVGDSVRSARELVREAGVL